MPEPFRTDDELVSAVLDGEATADERSQVAADPALSARLAEFAAVADALSAPGTPPTAAGRDAAIAAAVAAGGRQQQQVVVALRPRRSTGSFLAVAAAVLVVLLFAGLLVGQVGDGNETEDSASSAGDDSGSDRVEESGGATASDEAAVEPETDDEALLGESAPIELGVVADEAALREALVASEALDAFGASPTTRSTLPPSATAPEDFDTVPGDSEACLVRLEELDPALDGVLLEGTAAYAGTEAVVYVFATVDGDTRVEVVTADTCETLVSFPL